jgi:hypothetical protein
MLSESTIKIIRDISQFIGDSGGECAEWHIGATSDVDLRLLRDLGIDSQYRWQVCRCALSAAEARAIVLGFKNLSCTETPDPNNADGDGAVYVFAYRRTPSRANAPNGRTY